MPLNDRSVYVFFWLFVDLDSASFFLILKPAHVYMTKFDVHMSLS